MRKTERTLKMTDFSKYLIVTDLDGTFLDSTGHTAPRNVEAVKRFQSGGGMFTIASGRVHFIIPPAIPNVSTLLNAPAALCNGSLLYDFRTDTSYMEDLMPEKDVNDLLHYFATYEPDAYLRASTREGMYYDELTTPFSESPLRFYDPATYTIEPDISKWPRKDWYKLVVCFPTAEKARDVRLALGEYFGDRFSLTTANAKTAEIYASGISKATGIEKLRHLTPEMAERTIIACGDFLNDVEMLQAADIAVCPANASKEAKSVADFVLCDHNEGLIAAVVEALENGQLNKKGA
ncbi:MAG: HAD-IIB family hydrolase [Ruminococcaceae bacterium]|nr:HAD-IIB family hydrolase [Oscillospiraceae bacterium]